MQLFAADVTHPGRFSRGGGRGGHGPPRPPKEGPNPLVLARKVGESVIPGGNRGANSNVFMHTTFHADRGDTGVRIHDKQTPIEQMLAGARVGYTVLRPGWFFQNLWAAPGFKHRSIEDFLSQELFARPSHHQHRFAEATASGPALTREILLAFETRVRAHTTSRRRRSTDLVVQSPTLTR